MVQVELNCELMLNWSLWKETVFHIVTAYLFSTELFLLEMSGNLPVSKEKLDLYSTKFFEI